MNLWEYEGKWVRITDIDGEIFTGYADIYHDAEDNESGISSLALELNGDQSGLLVSFDENEIAAIEIITAAIAMPMETVIRN